MTGISLIPAPIRDTEVRAIISTSYERVAGAHDALAATLGCNHLPARPAINQVEDWSTVTQLQREAASTAETLSRWRSSATHPCRCGALELAAHPGHTWGALARFLSALQRPDTGTIPRPTLADMTRAAWLNRVESSITELDEQLSRVESSTADLAERIALARGFAEAATGRVTQVFSRAATAGCVHIPATVTSARVPADLAALQRLRQTAWRVHEAIAPVVLHGYRDLDLSEQDVKPMECCGALPAPTCAAVLAVVREWARTLEASCLYATHGETHGPRSTKSAMSQSANALDTAAENLNLRF